MYQVFITWKSVCCNIARTLPYKRTRLVVLQLVRTPALCIPDTLDRHAYFYSLTHRSMVDSYGLTNSLTLYPIVVIALCPCYYMRSTLRPVTILAMPFALARHVYKLMYL